MKKLFYILLVILLSSCSTTYHYSVMSTNDPYLEQNKRGEFVMDGNEIAIYYSFHGLNAPINITVQNKTEQPIYIDWRKSGIVLNSETVPYLPPSEEILDGYDNDDPRRLVADRAGVMPVEPYSKDQRTMIELDNLQFYKIKGREYNQTHIERDEKGRGKSFASIAYTNESSPIKLLSYLTVYLDNKSMKNPIVFESDFYMSEIINGNQYSPENFPAYRRRQGNVFMTKKETGYKFWGSVGTCLGTTALVGVLVVGAVASAVVEDGDSE